MERHGGVQRGDRRFADHRSLGAIQAGHGGSYRSDVEPGWYRAAAVQQPVDNLGGRLGVDQGAVHVPQHGRKDTGFRDASATLLNQRRAQSSGL